MAVSLAKLVTIKTGCGIESNKRLGSLRVPSRRSPEARSAVALHALSGSEVVTLVLPKDFDRFSPGYKITSAPLTVEGAENSSSLRFLDSFRSTPSMGHVDRRGDRCKGIGAAKQLGLW